MSKILILFRILVSIHVLYGQSTTKTSLREEYDAILPRFVSDEYDCEKYKLLVNSEWIEYNCPTSMKWNQSLSLCVNYNAAEERCSSIYESLENKNIREGITDSKDVAVSTIFIGKRISSYWSICSTYFCLY